jgi:uncharacterized protein
MLRVVLDANVLVSGLISSRGAPATLLRRWLAGWFELVVSPALLAEVERALGYPKLRSVVSRDEAEAFVVGLRRSAVVVDDPGPAATASVPADPGDDYLVALARAAGAHVLVSGDQHLLGLAEPDPPVVTPREFLERLEADAP